MEFELNRRKALAFLMVVGVVAAGAGAGTMAYFSDTGHSNGNTISAGTLNLQVNGQEGNYQLLSAGNVAPGYSASDTVSVSNNGSIAGNLSVTLSETQAENGVKPPENNTGNETAGAVELGNKSTVTVWLDSNDNGALDNGEWNVSGDPSTIAGTYSNVAQLGASGQTHLAMSYDVPTSVKNSIQSDSVTVNATLSLEQQH